MNTKIIVSLLIGIIAIGGIANVAASDADTPWSGTVKWDIPSDTSFTIHFSGVTSSIDFNATGQNDTMIEPVGQDDGASEPVVMINNTGNQDLTFNFSIPAGAPSWVTMLNMSNSNTYLGSSEVNTTGVDIETSVGQGTSTQLYLWSNVTLAPSGVTEKTAYINSSIS